MIDVPVDLGDCCCRNEDDEVVAPSLTVSLGEIVNVILKLRLSNIVVNSVMEIVDDALC